MNKNQKASTYYRISDSLSVGSFEGHTDEIKAWQKQEREQSYVMKHHAKTGALRRAWNVPYAGRKKITEGFDVT